MTEIDCIEAVKSLGLENYDFVLFGDGSGTTANTPCGWACIAVEKGPQTPSIAIYRGGTSNGTNNLAELCPYLFAIWHIDSRYLNVPMKPKSIAIVSDSEMTVRCGNREYERRANAPFWSSMEWFEASGRYQFTWKHVRRNSNPLNARCDLLAGETRKYFCGNI